MPRPSSPLIITLVCGAALAGTAAAYSPDDSAISTTVAVDEDSNGFQQLDPAILDDISGKVLTFTAYSIILSAVVFYCLSLLIRERSVLRAIRRLEKTKHHRREDSAR